MTDIVTLRIETARFKSSKEVGFCAWVTFSALSQDPWPTDTFALFEHNAQSVLEAGKKGVVQVLIEKEPDAPVSTWRLDIL